MTAELLSIGQVASRTGVTVGALRHYDEVGVVVPATRVGGKRRFTEDAVGRVNFVRRAQRFGFSLDDIRKMLATSQGGHHRLLEDRIRVLHSQQRELAEMIVLLEALRECGCEILSECTAMTEDAGFGP